MASPSPNPNRIQRESFANAITALLKWIQSQPKHQKSQLFEADDILYLILTLTRIPSKGRTNPYRIPIPHPLHPFDPQSTSICLLLDDRPSSPLPPSAALDQIQTRNLPISSVIGLSELSSDYRPYESRRKLCDSYDLFFADRKIIPLLPRLLGKHFFKRKKIPLAVDTSRVGWSEQIRSWCESSLLYLRTGTCSGLKIGRVNQSEDVILENAMAAIEGAMEFVPKKWGNLRSVHVKTVESVALPVYQAVPEIGLKIEGIWDEKDGSFAMGKKRGRGEKEKKAKKEKKARIHDVGSLDGDDGVSGDGDVVSEEVVVEKRVKKKLKKEKDGNDELKKEKDGNDELKKEKKRKKKKGLEIREEEDGLMLNGDNEDDNVVLNDEVEEDESGVKTMKKKGKKGGKVKEKKRVGDDTDGGEENAVGELSEKRSKKKKIEEDAIVASDGMKKSKQKKKQGDDDVVLNDELGVEKELKKKVKMGGKAKPGKGSGKEDVGEETGGNDLREKRIKKKKTEKDAVVASDGMKKGKRQNQRIKM